MLLAAILPPAAFAPTGLPTAFDLRSVNGSNILGPVRNHHLPIGSSCASCWSVNTATVLAGRINLARARSGQPDISLQLSAQYLLNCVPGQERCGYPGSAGAALEHVVKHGMPSESCAPWQNAKLPCDALHLCAARLHNQTFVAVPHPTLYRPSSVQKTAAGDVAGMQRAVLDGPIACGVHAEGLLDYERGVLIDPPSSGTKDDHSIAVVGWGEEGGVPYWIVQNNWGTEWGEGGFVRLKRGANLLGIEGGCHAPVVGL